VEELGCTGNRSMRVFQMLSAGKTVQLPIVGVCAATRLARPKSAAKGIRCFKAHSYKNFRIGLQGRCRPSGKCPRNLTFFPLEGLSMIQTVGADNRPDGVPGGDYQEEFVRVIPRSALAPALPQRGRRVAPLPPCCCRIHAPTLRLLQWPQRYP
jgi:hypothetical protein